MRLTHCQASLELDPVGAVVSEAELFIGDRAVRPFFQNPWRDDPRKMDTLTRHLGAEWPCVPFGVPQPPAGLPADWQCAKGAVNWHRHAQGYGAHADWTWTQQNDRSALAEITYPAAGPIAGLRRQVTLADENEIRFNLEIEAREDCRVPVGLHPVLSLTDAAPGAAILEIAGADTAWTFPVDVEPGRSHLAADQRAVPFRELVTSDGGRLGGFTLPFPGQTEDLVLLAAPGGRVSLLRPDRGYRVDVRWNADDLPCCLLWLSNRGRDYGPWDGRVCAVGIEPVAAAFDLGVAHSASATTPLALAGVESCVALSASHAWKTEYAISLHGIQA